MPRAPKLDYIFLDKQPESKSKGSKEVWSIIGKSGKSGVAVEYYSGDPHSKQALALVATFFGFSADY